MIRAIDLFAGAGGLSLGLQQVGIEIVAAIERDPDACASYRANVGDHMIEASIEDVDAASLPDCDLIAGGPPCQGFSYAGKRDRDDPRNQLWREFFRIVEAKQPAWIIVENVRGMLTLGEDKPLILAFRDIGYHVSPYLLNAADYGVPQVRLRVFYIGNRIGVANPCPPPTHAQPPRHLMFGLAPWVTVRQALGIGGSDVYIPLDRPSPTINSGEKSNGGGGHGDPIRHRLKERLPHHLLDEPSRALRAGVHGQPGYSPRHEAGYVSNVDLDRPSPTIQGGGTETGGAEPVRHRLRDEDFPLDRPALTIQCDSRVSRPGHHGPDEPRMGLRRLTVRECATLQDFPPSFVFHGSKTSQYRQVGNAAPPGLVRALGEAILAADAKAREGAA